MSMGPRGSTVARTVASQLRTQPMMRGGDMASAWQLKTMALQDIVTVAQVSMAMLGVAVRYKSLLSV